MPRGDRDDDDDDRPRRRRPRRDEDDDDRPRGDGGGGSKALLVVVVVVVGGTLALGLLACAGFFLVAAPSANAKVQAAADRAKSQNNMKQMSIGMHAQHDVNGTFQGPLAAGATVGAQSFRVGLLPYIEQDGLYKRIDLTQAWDSAKNSPATDTTVPGYLDLTNPASVGTATPYRLFVGPGALFDGGTKMPKFQDVTDGTSSTILYVAATQTVPWAKPQELPFGPGVPLPPLGSPQADGFLVAMADGSVRYLKRTIPDADLRALITRAGGEVVNIP